jgi:DNA helicase-2/ATP-dependent DNA helicase PcrA
MLLLSDKRHNWNMVSGEIDFIEPDRKTGDFANHKYVVSEEDLSTVGEQISDTFEKIKQHDFDKTCGEDDCYWCSFVHDNYKLNPALLDTEHNYDK